MADADAPHVCIFCDAKFSDRVALQDHFRAHGNETLKRNNFKPRAKPDSSSQPKPKVQVQCEHCPLKFAEVSGAINHLYSRHRELAVKHMCPWCGSQFPIMHTYEIHLKTHPVKDAHEKHECPMCYAVFHNRTALDYHHKMNHANEAIARPVVLPPPSKKLHIRAGVVQSVYYCHYCGQEYILKFNLQRHLKSVHTEEMAIPVIDLIKCTTCEAYFYNQKGYEYHNRFHKQDDVYIEDEEMRQKVITKIDQDFDPQRVRSLYAGAKHSAAAARKMSQKRAEIAASIGNTSAFSPPPSSDSDSDEEPNRKIIKSELSDECDQSQKYSKTADINNFDKKVSKANMQKTDTIRTCNETENEDNERAKIKNDVQTKNDQIDIKVKVEVDEEIHNTNKEVDVILNLEVNSKVHDNFDVNLGIDNTREITNNLEIPIKFERNENPLPHPSSDCIPSMVENETGELKNMQLLLAENNVFKCELCPLSMQSIHHAIFHKLMLHTNLTTSSNCQWCGKSFIIRHLYQMHVKCHEKMTYDTTAHCSLCNDIFFNEAALQYHVSNHHREVKCPIDLKPSINVLTSDDFQFVLAYYCPFCGIEYNSNHSLAEHINEVHPRESVFGPSRRYSRRCMECLATFHSHAALVDHISNHESINSQENVNLNLHRRKIFEQTHLEKTKKKKCETIPVPTAMESLQMEKPKRFYARRIETNAVPKITDETLNDDLENFKNTTTVSENVNLHEVNVKNSVITTKSEPMVEDNLVQEKNISEMQTKSTILKVKPCSVGIERLNLKLISNKPKLDKCHSTIPRRIMNRKRKPVIS